MDLERLSVHIPIAGSGGIASAVTMHCAIYGRPSVSLNIPAQTHSRREISPVLVLGRKTRESGIARKKHFANLACRSSYDGPCMSRRRKPSELGNQNAFEGLRESELIPGPKASAERSENLPDSPRRVLVTQLVRAKSAGSTSGTPWRAAVKLTDPCGVPNSSSNIVGNLIMLTVKHMQ